MEKDEFLKSLLRVNKLINQLDIAQKSMEESEEQKRQAKFHYKSQLEEFDREHKEAFIKSQLGSEPQKEKWLKEKAKEIFKRDNSYSSQKKVYDEKRPLAEKLYESHFSAEREELKKKDEQLQAEEISKANERFEFTRDKYREAKDELEKDNSVAPTLKEKEIIQKLISYIVEGRAETRKEAINLLYDEKRKDEQEAKEAEHRELMEDYARRQCEATEEAAESARQAAESASEAADEARRAREAAEEAKDAVQNNGNSNY